MNTTPVLEYEQKKSSFLSVSLSCKWRFFSWLKRIKHLLFSPYGWWVMWSQFDASKRQKKNDQWIRKQFSGKASLESLFKIAGASFDSSPSLVIFFLFFVPFSQSHILFFDFWNALLFWWRERGFSFEGVLEKGPHPFFFFFEIKKKSFSKEIQNQDNSWGGGGVGDDDVGCWGREGVGVACFSCETNQFLTIGEIS